MMRRRRYAILALLCVSAGLAGAEAAFPQPSPQRRRSVHRPVCFGTLVATDPNATDLATDATHLYFGDLDGNVQRVLKNGGNEPDLLLSYPGMWTLFLTLDQTNIYYTVSPRGGAGPAAVYKLPKEGGTSTLLVPGTGFVRDLAADDDWLYVLVAGTMAGGATWNADGYILRVRKDGSASETIAASLRLPYGMRLERDDLYFIESGVNSSDRSGGLRRVSKSGGEISNVGGVPWAWSMTMDEANFYVLSRVVGTPYAQVSSVSRADGHVTPLVTGLGFVEITSLEIARGMLYFPDILPSGRAELEVYDTHKGERRSLQEYDWSFPLLAVDSCAIYFSTTGGIYRLPH